MPLKHMTLSPQARRKNLEEALIGFLDALGDRPLRCLDIIPSAFPGLLPTTWIELTNGGLLKDQNIQIPMFRLTCAGYVEALKVSGRSGEPRFLEGLGNLCKVLKSHLPKDRTGDALISFDELVTKCGLSEAFVENALDADLIRHILGRVGAYWDGQGVVRVPQDFGLTL